MKQSLDTKTVSWAELIGNGRTFIVPRFQRDYSWEQSHWEDLWYDICELESEKFHFMDYVVLQQSEDEKKFVIIDGQQRFTTLSIIALAIIKILEDLADGGIEPEKNKERSEALRSSFIGYKDPASLVTKSKLVLNRNNDDHYQSYIVRLRKRESLSRLKPPEKLMSKAFDYFYETIKEYFKKNLSGERLAGFLNNVIAEYLCFTKITVDTDVNAFKVFETLNARGVRLSTTDLLKNLLFSIVDSGGQVAVDQAERQWQSINNILGNIGFPVYLRHFWNSRNTLARQQTLFKDVKKSLKGPGSAINLLDELEKMAEVYSAFSKPEDELWRKDSSKKQSIDCLNLFNVSQCYSLLLSAYEKLDDREFTKLLKYCVVISFRYNIVGGLNPNRIEKAYNETAQKIYNGQLKQARDIFYDLKDIYRNDAQFINDFTYLSIETKRKHRLVRYILFSIENHLSKRSYDFDGGTITIEHILPDSLDEEWEKSFNATLHDQYTDRLGNYTLLEEKYNKKCGQKSYLQKLEIYKKSVYKMSSSLDQYSDWVPKSIEKRQAELAKYAAQIWKIDM